MEARQPGVVADGRAGTVEAITISQAAATATVGDDGGVVLVGPSRESFDQSLLWGPPGDGARQRQGLALVAPSATRLAAVRHEGLTDLTGPMARRTHDEPRSTDGGRLLG